MSQENHPAIIRVGFLASHFFLEWTTHTNKILLANTDRPPQQIDVQKTSYFSKYNFQLLQTKNERPTFYELFYLI